MADTSYDVLVIGGGPGGYVAAIRAAQLGLKTVCVEKEALGGVCLNWGCIPTKALLKASEVLETCRHAGDFGIQIQGEITFDFAKVMGRSREVAASQEKGIHFLFKKNKVEHKAGKARLLGAGKVDVETAQGKETLKAKHIIVATGARARTFPSLPLDGKHLIEYRGALGLTTQPKRLAVIGAGAIGVEFASFFHTLGTEVTIIELQPRLVPVEDEEISDLLGKSFRKRGIKLLLGSKVTASKPTGDTVSLTIEKAEGGGNAELEIDQVLVAVGVQANVENLGLEQIGVGLDKGFIKVERGSYATSVKGVYAIGDVIGPPALAHVASSEAIKCVDHIAGKNPRPIDYDSVPACTFCHPEIGSVGLTEAKAKAAGHELKVGRFPFSALGKSRAAGDTEGFVKVVWDARDGRLLGGHIIGHNASDLIAELGLAKATEVNAESLIETIHSHPTLAEAMKEATEQAYGHAIHI